MNNRARNLHEWISQHSLLWGLVLVVVFSLLRFIQTITWQNWFSSLDFPVSPQFALFLAVWFIILSIGLIIGGIVWLARVSWQQLGWSRKGLPKAIGSGLLGFVLLYLNIIIWAIAKGSTQQSQLAVPDLGRLLLVAFFAFGQPAWVEENLYRGYLQPIFSQRMKLGYAIILQGAIFSLAHLGYLNTLLDFGQSFVAGVILGWIRGHNSNLLAPFIAHGLFWLMIAFIPAT